jgi:signal transduction histidine kinase
VRSLTRALAMLALAALVLGLIVASVNIGSAHVQQRGLTVALGLAIGWAWVGIGLFAWWRRPANRFGALMVLVGFLWLVAGLTGAEAPGIFTAAVVVSQVYLAAVVHLLLAYPDGRIEASGERRVVVGAYALALLAPLPALMFDYPEAIGDCACPRSVIEVGVHPRLFGVLDALTSVVAVALVAYLLVVVTRRWQAATPAQRPAMAPLLWSMVGLLLLVAGGLTSQTIGLPGGITDALMLAGTVAFGSIPLAFLSGLLRSRFARAGAVGELLLRLAEQPGTGGLRDLLADALGDRSLELLYWIDDKRCWVDRDGQAAELPAPDDPERSWTAVELEGRQVGAIVHDVSLCEDPDALRTVAAAAGLTVQNERLEAQLRNRVEELRTSRSRLVEAAVLERRRLERDLHDGAQQRLVALSLSLRLAQSRVRDDPDRAEALLAGAQQELATALSELRELARGIHPAVLADRGLDAALEALASRSPVPVRLLELPPERLPAAVEAAAYYVIAEALTNVVKYAHASQATVAVQRRNGHAVVEVRDDGVGGANPEQGSGLHGLVDRVGALDGSLSLDSPAGAGTRLRAEIPV